MRIALISASLLLCVSFQLSAQEKIQDPLQTTHFQLENGLTVMLTENHNTPQIFGVIAVRAGGKNDPADATGMAHYLEHMLFKGTTELGTWDYAKEKIHLDQIEALYEELGKTSDEAKRLEIQKKINDESIQAGKYAIPNEMDRMLSEIGAKNVNAFTTEDFTAYHDEFPSNQLEKWLQVYDHRFENPVFRLFQSELETVYEEKNRSMDSPFSIVIDEFNKNFWKKHPYGQQPIIGHTEHLKNPSLQKMYDYFKTYYVANNMVLALSGDFKTEEAIALIKKYFSDWRTGEVPVFPEYPEEAFKGNEKIEIKATPIKVLVRGYRIPPNNHPDAKAIEIANFMLSNNEGSGLLDMLATDGKLTFAAMMPMQYNDYGAGTIICAPKIIGQSFEDAEKMIEEQLDLLRKGQFEASFFEGAKLSCVKNIQYQLESNESRALMLVNAFTSRISWESYIKQALNLNRISKEQVIAAVNKYYGSNFLSLYSSMGNPKKDKLSKPPFEPVIPEDGKSSQFYNTWRMQNSPELEARFLDPESAYQKMRLSELVELRTIQNPFNQMFSLDLSWGYGSDYDSILFYLPEYLNKLGTTDQSAVDFKKALFAQGASLSFSADKSSFHMSIEGLESRLGATVKLVADFLVNLKHDQQAIASLSEDLASNRKLDNKDPNNLLMALNNYALFKNQSPELRQLKSSVVKKLSTQDMDACLKRAMQYGIKISYTGKMQLASISDSLKLVLPLLKPGKKALEAKILAAQGFESNKVYFLNDKKAVQSQIMVLINGKQYNPEIMGSVKAFNHYFGNDMSSLLFQEIREFRSLAYSTSGGYRMAAQKGDNDRFSAYVGCQGDKTPEALETLLSLIKDMPAKKDRMDAIRASLIADVKSNKPGFREVFRLIDSWERVGMRYDPGKKLLPFYHDLTYDQIDSFYKTYIQNQSMQIIIVGNSKKFDPAILKTYGEVIKVKSKQIIRD